MIDRVLANSYRVVEKVGEGGMGAVYRAIDVMLERDVAIKAIRPELAREPEMVERFRTEARTLARVSHPAIATIYSFFQDDSQNKGELFLAMEYVRGRSLSKVLETEGALPWDRAVRLLASALDGIAEAHRAGVIHRDLKPDNLMITESGTVKVMDFGIARMAGTGHLTRTGLMVGTLRYMAPEQIQGEEADARSDIYSLGGVLYQMLTGRPAFEGKSDYAILKAQIEEMPPPPSAAAPGPGIPDWLDRAVLRALAKNPADRFQSVEEMRHYLDTRGAGEAREAPRTSLLPVGEIEELPTIVTPPRAALPPLPPIPTAPSPRPLPAIPPPAVPTMASGAAPASTDVGLYEAIPSRSRPAGRGLGWKLAVAAAGVVAVLTGVGLAVFTRDDAPGETAATTETAATIATAEPTPAAEGGFEVAQNPEPRVVITPADPAPGQATPPPSTPIRPRPTPEPTLVQPEETGSPSSPVETVADPRPAEPEPAPEADLAAAPIEELKQLGTDLQGSSARFLATYQAFLEQKEDAGGEITDDDEELEELIESFAGSAEKFNKQIQGGGFLARLRKRSDTEARPQLGKRAKDLADRAARVDALIAKVQPSAEVHQAWQELRQRGQRAGRLVSSLR